MKDRRLIRLTEVWRPPESLTRTATVLENGQHFIGGFAEDKDDCVLGEAEQLRHKCGGWTWDTNYCMYCGEALNWMGKVRGFVWRHPWLVRGGTRDVTDKRTD